MSSPQHEPTMEEILASIRKIISEDNPESVPVAAPKPVVVAVPAGGESEVMELTQEVAAAAPSPLPPEPELVPEPPKPQEAVEAKTDEIVFEPIPERQPVPDNDIFSDRTRRAMEDSFDLIPDEPQATAPTRPERAAAASDGASVESVFERAVQESFEPVLEKYLADNSGLVIERMKPLIREWMDENFPALLENAVRAEVERIAKARTRR